MKRYTLKIITPEKVIFDGPVREVILPTRAGQAGVLADHVPYMAPLRADELLIYTGEDQEDKSGEQVLSIAVDFGIAEFVDNQLTVLVAEASPAPEINLELAEAAKRRAQTLMQEKIADTEAYAAAQAVLERELAKIKVAHKYRLHKTTTPNPLAEN